MSGRITKETDGGHTVIHFEAWLCSKVVPAREKDCPSVIEAWIRSKGIPALEKECPSVDGPLVLDCSELPPADKAGIEKLREWPSEGAELRGASQFWQMIPDD